VQAAAVVVDHHRHCHWKLKRNPRSRVKQVVGQEDHQQQQQHQQQEDEERDVEEVYEQEQDQQRNVLRRVHDAAMWS
ncbi:uncharacterized protein, partial [Drosophila suzukii]|uniref:Uncharacterized protein n=1 Tax=Drosophila suzukii TaxID=28584 RepID=A0AB40DKR5_DROSZ